MAENKFALALNNVCTVTGNEICKTVGWDEKKFVKELRSLSWEITLAMVPAIETATKEILVSIGVTLPEPKKSITKKDAEKPPYVWEHAVIDGLKQAIDGITKTALCTKIEEIYISNNPDKKDIIRFEANEIQRKADEVAIKAGTLQKKDRTSIQRVTSMVNLDHSLNLLEYGGFVEYSSATKLYKFPVPMVDASETTEVITETTETNA